MLSTYQNLIYADDNPATRSLFLSPFSHVGSVKVTQLNDKVNLNPGPPRLQGLSSEAYVSVL